MTIKTIADFKRAMVPGSKWDATHEYIGNNPTPPKSLGIRECGLNNTVNFAFKTDRNTLSYSQWPKKTEFSVQNNGKTIVITKENFCRLTYTLID